MSERAAPFFCPYCGDEDLRPSEVGHGAWECHGCRRAFQLKFLGLLSPASGAQANGAQADGARTGEAQTGGAQGDGNPDNASRTSGGSAPHDHRDH
ncbi:hypothetical protein ACWC5I_21915 [Kitasatospora sp. NPDC001574]